MSIKQVKVVGVYVNDQERALDFYTRALGFEVLWDERYGDDYRWIEVAPPGASTTISLSKFDPDRPNAVVGGFSNCVFATDDILGTHAELSGRGVEFIEPPTMQPWGMMQAIFADLDGNQFVLVQR